MTYLEGVYWDLDGTIANTELEAHLPAFNNAFHDLGIKWNWDTSQIHKTFEDKWGKIGLPTTLNQITTISQKI